MDAALKIEKKEKTLKLITSYFLPAVLNTKAANILQLNYKKC
jgi:hypothetical protein